MLSVVLKIRRYCTVGDGSTPGSSSLYYSWDGTTWYWLTGGTKTDTTEESFILENFTGSTNLNSLRVRMDVSPGSEWDDILNKMIWFASTFRTYDLGVEVYAGPQLTVNSISGPTSVYAGLQCSLSTTVTNDSTNNCTWSIRSGGGSLSGAVNDATSSRVTFNAPSSSGGSTVIRCTSNIDPSKYSEITISVPTVGVSLTSGPSRMRAGGQGYYQVTVTGHSDTRVQWSIPAGSLNVNPANGTTWTVPSTPGRYVISGYHVYDTSKTFSYAVYVDYFYPSNYTVGTADATKVSCSVSAGGYAFDEQLSTYACAATLWVSADGGVSYGYYDLYDFPDTPNLVSTKLVLYYSAYAVEIYYSVDGGQNWIYGTNSAGNGNGTPVVLTVAPGSIYNLNQLRVRFRIYASAAQVWDDNEQQWDLIRDNGYVYLYEIRAEPTQRAYSAVTGTSDRGTTSTPLYMPGQFQPLTGTMPGVGTTPVALAGPGSSTSPVAIPFFLGAAAG